MQLARLLGARVTAAGAARHAPFLRRPGADRFVDLAEPFARTAAGVDVVLDIVGGDVQDRAYGVLRPGGRLVALASPPDRARAHEHGVSAEAFTVRPDAAALEQIAALVDDGRLRPIVAETLPLTLGRRAYQAGRRRRPGKTVLTVR
ncbi:zinc-binding dehydrogenase [Actinomadura sp. PM05-2]|uniref:Zinc-binding dehydrogenase n=1 Tax=Actinomadura parmotrematis TaxID=2864039 RepID=A0ABS7FM16_9ACTN|nr:zinc-binding dehydrogenase [Actinomadura parmotrematis]